MTVKDMRQVADELEWRTASKYKNEVGGLLQLAVLSGGAVSTFDPYVDERSEPQGLNFNWLIEPKMHNREGRPGVVGILASPERPVFVSRADASGVTQPLDNVLFTGSTFTNCILTYDGSPLALFDKTNVVQNSELRIGHNVAPNDPFVMQLKLDFPQLFVAVAR